jgi:hypothetical protein
MRRLFVFTILLAFTFVSQSFACFNPTDFFATEVILNKPGVSYDLEPIRLAANVSFENGAFIYRSHFDKRVAVILEEINQRVLTEKLNRLSVRIQIPTRTEDGDLTEAIDVTKEDFDFKSAIKIELDWLANNGIIIGIGELDFAKIPVIVEAGTAGWNARIVYEDGKWLPYNQTKNPALIRSMDCSGFALEKIAYEDTIILPIYNSISIKGRLVTCWGMMKTSDLIFQP